MSHRKMRSSYEGDKTMRSTKLQDASMNNHKRATYDETCKYVLISPVRDEEEYIKMTLDSVANQTVLPVEWILVDDGSSDRTPEIIDEFARTHPWIRLKLRADRGKRAIGAGVIEAFNFGLKHLSVSDYEFLVKLDGDLSFGPTYFEDLFRKFSDNRDLGIASGKTYIERRGNLVVERMADQHVRGASKVYRRACFEQIDGLKPIIGWDMVDELYAQYKGWETRSFAELVLVHHRPMGTSTGSALRGKLRWGRGRYVTGSHPVFILASGTYRMTEHPYVLGGLALMYGYFTAWLNRHPRITESEIREFQKRRELKRLSPGNLWRFLSKESVKSCWHRNARPSMKHGSRR